MLFLYLYNPVPIPNHSETPFESRRYSCELKMRLFLFITCYLFSVRYKRSQRGRPLLCLGIDTFCTQRVSGFKTCWGCTKKSMNCPAVVVTYDGVIIQIRNAHNHWYLYLRVKPYNITQQHTWVQSSSYLPVNWKFTIKLPWL